MSCLGVQNDRRKAIINFDELNSGYSYTLIFPKPMESMEHSPIDRIEQFRIRKISRALTQHFKQEFKFAKHNFELFLFNKSVGNIDFLFKGRMTHVLVKHKNGFGNGLDEFHEIFKQNTYILDVYKSTELTKEKFPGVKAVSIFYTETIDVAKKLRENGIFVIEDYGIVQTL
jgi:hypothetical protein